MKRGQTYIGVSTGIIVLCSADTQHTVFEGTVINKGRSSFEKGYYSKAWEPNMFKEYNEISKIPNELVVLEENRHYIIPENCKVVIKKSTISIQSNIKYYYVTGTDYKMYIKADNNQFTQLKVYSDGDIDIYYRNNRTTTANMIECSKSEFEEVFNNIALFKLMANCNNK